MQGPTLTSPALHADAIVDKRDAWLRPRVRWVQPFNVLRYEPGQHYDSHYDIFEPESYGPQPSQRVRSRPAVFALHISITSFIPGTSCSPMFVPRALSPCARVSAIDYWFTCTAQVERLLAYTRQNFTCMDSPGPSAEESADLIGLHKLPEIFMTYQRAAQMKRS